jgi:SpoVK/Ycf46/Vps4 family AAA+-type ATPase
MVDDPKLMDDLLTHNVEVEGREPEQQSVWTQLLVASFPILIIIAVFMFFMRQMQGGAGGRGGPMSFGKSKARLLGEDQITTTFADVAGVDEAKEDVQELVEFLRDPSRFQKLGGRIPRGVLMAGQPGTGKTELARQVAAALGMPLLEWGVKSTTRAQQGLYEYDAVSRLRDSQLGDARVDDVRNYIRRGMLWQAFAAEARVVLLIDEIDKAEVEIPNDL